MRGIWISCIRLVHSHKIPYALLGWSCQSAEGLNPRNNIVTSFVICDHFFDSAVFHYELLDAMNHMPLLLFYTFKLSGAHTSS